MKMFKLGYICLPVSQEELFPRTPTNCSRTFAPGRRANFFERLSRRFTAHALFQYLKSWGNSDSKTLKRRFSVTIQRYHRKRCRQMKASRSTSSFEEHDAAKYALVRFLPCENICGRRGAHAAIPCGNSLQGDLTPRSRSIRCHYFYPVY